MKATVPQGWRWVSLNDVCTEDRQVIDGQSDAAGVLPYVSLENIESVSGKIVLYAESNSSTQGISNCFRFDSEHVLYGKLRPYLNKVALPDFSGRCTTEAIPILPKPEIDREFLAWTLRRRETVDWAMTGKTGSRMPRVKMKHLMNLDIPLPPLAEQKRIVAVLNKQMAALERVEAVRALSSAWLREVFSSGVDNLPHGWRWAKLGEVCQINPCRPKEFRRDDGDPTTFIPMGAVNGVAGKVDKSQTRPYREVKKGYTFFADGDILFAKITPCMQNGKHFIASNLTDGVGFASTEFHVLRPDDFLLPRWVHFYLRQPSILKEATYHFTGTAGQQRVPGSFLKNLPCPLPPLPEQKRLVSALNAKMATTQKALTAAQAELEAITALPSALLRKAFNGAL